MIGRERNDDDGGGNSNDSEKNFRTTGVGRNIQPESRCRFNVRVDTACSLS